MVYYSAKRVVNSRLEATECFDTKLHDIIDIYVVGVWYVFDGIVLRDYL